MHPDQERVKRILAAAADLGPGSERDRYLDEACGGDLELRAEVEELLAAYTQAGDFLDLPGVNANGESWEAAGTTIGRYRLIREIGEGAFGRVFLAQQSDPVKRTVALKIIKPGMDTREVIARFEAERQALALMDHPYIARVIDAGQTDNGRPYFVMDLVNGLPVTEYCDQNRLTIEDRVWLFIGICQAVQHAHQKGIIHRDLKPTNILVTETDTGPVPKVIDFGIAKALDQKLTERTLFTALNQMIGTPAYMSPEQADANSTDVDTRSDIYSLGILLYELLTGVTPLDKESYRKAAIDEIRHLIRDTEAPKPSTRLKALGPRLTGVAQRRKADPTNLPRLLGGDLDWIIMKALEKDRSRRYETADAFQLDLLRFLNHEPARAGPPDRLYRARKFVQRHRVGVAIASVLVASLGVALTVSLLALARARKAEARAEEETASVLAINQFFTRDFLQQAAPENQADRDIKLRTLLDRALAQVGVKFRDKPLLEAEIRETLGTVYLSLGQYRTAQEQIQAALSLYSACLGRTHLKTLRVQGISANVTLLQGKPSEAAELSQRLLSTERVALGAEHLETLQTMQTLAQCWWKRGLFDSAQDLLGELLQLQRRVLGPKHTSTLRTMYLISAVAYDQGKETDAYEWCQSVLAIQRRVLGPEHPDTLRTLQTTIVLAKDVLSVKESRLRELLSIERKVLGSEHRQTLLCMNNLLALLVGQGSTMEAERLGRELLSTQRRVLGTEHPDTIDVLRLLGMCIDEAGALWDAYELTREAVCLSQKVLGPDHPVTLSCIFDLVCILARHSPEEALKLVQQLIPVQERVLGSTHPATVRSQRKHAALSELSRPEAFRYPTTHDWNSPESESFGTPRLFGIGAWKFASLRGTNTLGLTPSVDCSLEVIPATNTDRPIEGLQEQGRDRAVMLRPGFDLP